MCDCASRVHPGIECGSDWCRCHLVDLDKWNPGEDVDDDALVKEELLRKRDIMGKILEALKQRFS